MDLLLWNTQSWAIYMELGLPEKTGISMEKAGFSDFAAIGFGMDRSDAQAGKKAKAFTDSVRMCSKCCRKLDAKGKTLRKAVKAAIRDAYGEDVQLEKVDCFSLCPKGGQVLSTSAARHNRRLVIVEPDSDVAMAVEYLLRDAEA